MAITVIAACVRKRLANGSFSGAKTNQTLENQKKIKTKHNKTELNEIGRGRERAWGKKHSLARSKPMASNFDVESQSQKRLSGRQSALSWLYLFLPSVPLVVTCQCISYYEIFKR